MNAIKKKIYNELKQHIKICDIDIHNKNNDILFSCEVDRIQSVARGIINRIIKKHGNYQISSTTRNTKNLGFTKIVIYKGKNEK